jgi:hypothetical protein
MGAYGWLRFWVTAGRLVTGSYSPGGQETPWGCFARGVVRAYHAKNVVSGRQMHKPGTDKCMNPGPTQTMPPDYAAPSSAPTDAAVPEMAQPTPMTSTDTFSATLVRDASPCTPRSRSAARGGRLQRAPRRHRLRASANAALVRAHTAAVAAREAATCSAAARKTLGLPSRQTLIVGRAPGRCAGGRARGR